MNTKTTLPISEARRKIFDIAEEVQKPNTHYMLTERGRPKAVIMSAEEFESWIETMEVMREFPDLNKDIAEINRAVKSGKYKKWTTLDELFKEYGFVSIKNRAKSKKSTRANSKNISR